MTSNLTVSPCHPARAAHAGTRSLRDDGLQGRLALHSVQLEKACRGQAAAEAASDAGRQKMEEAERGQAAAGAALARAAISVEYLNGSGDWRARHGVTLTQSNVANA